MAYDGRGLSPCAKMWGLDGLYPDSTGGGMALALSNGNKSVGLGWLLYCSMALTEVRHLSHEMASTHEDEFHCYGSLLPVGCTYDTSTLVPHLVVTLVVVLLASA